MSLPDSFTVRPTRKKLIQRWYEGCGYFKVHDVNYAFASGCGKWQSPCGKWMDWMPSHAPKNAPEEHCELCLNGWVGSTLVEIEEHDIKES